MPDFFETFGLAPSYFIDKDRLQSRFYELSRTSHPDKFHGRPDEELLEATERFAQINEALNTLKSDLSRSEYLLSLSGFESHSPAKNSLPAALADDYFTLQESLEDADMPQEAKLSQLADFGLTIDSELARLDLDRENLFSQWEKDGASLNKSAWPVFEKIAGLLNQRSYLASMKRDLELKCRTS